MTPLLSIRNLSVTFATGRGPFRAVDKVDLDVAPGELVAIVGESGSGKSVAMLAVMGLLPWIATVTADRMVFDGRDLLALSARERRKIIGRDLAMIFQEPMSSLNPCFTVGFQIREAMAAHLDLSRAQRQARAVELLELVGIPEPERRLRAFPHQLSGGMSQRVMIAMALACNPKLIIADEPTTALDVTIQAQIVALFQRLVATMDLTLVFIAHDLAIVRHLCTRVVVMHHGLIVEEGPCAEVFERPREGYTAALIAAIPDIDPDRRLIAPPPALAV
ncbi:MAG: ABC transporter ATP-binding protein [Starkeya sp.]|nr:ABC transporter ATP-binding protein [Starkeya sp.]